MTTVKAIDVDSLGEALTQVLVELIQVEPQTQVLKDVEDAFFLLLAKLARYWMVLAASEAQAEKENA